MRLGFNTGTSRFRGMDLDIPLIQEAERLGYTVVWTSEAYGFDAVVPLAYIAACTENIQLGTAIMQIAGRTPAMTAMTAASLNLVSGGRFLLGLGVSGPQVVEGWHGVPFGKPLGRMREYITILHRIFRRQEPLTHEGQYYHIPYREPGATGLGKPLKSIIATPQHVPIYLAANGPKNVALAGELADGLLPSFFSPDHFEVIGAPLRQGFARAGNGKGFDDFDLAVNVSVELGDDVKACQDRFRARLAFNIGVYGARQQNFYNDIVRRYGYDEVAENVQTLYLAGRKEEAIAAVPDTLVDALALCGPRQRIAERLSRFRQVPVKTFNIRTSDPEVLRMMAELVL